MGILTVEDFKVKCSEGKCYRHIIKSKRCDLDSKREQCYEKYCKQYDKNHQIKVDEDWGIVKKEVWERDKGYCRLVSCLSMEEWKKALDLLKQYGGSEFVIIDCAHVFNRSTHPQLKYNRDNIVLMYRIFHSRLDTNKHPITGKNISKEEHDKWWIKIIGKELWMQLKESR